MRLGTAHLVAIHDRPEVRPQGRAIEQERDVLGFGVGG
jgi:hypothetical protein